MCAMLGAICEAEGEERERCRCSTPVWVGWEGVLCP